MWISPPSSSKVTPTFQNLLTNGTTLTTIDLLWVKIPWITLPRIHRIMWKSLPLSETSLVLSGVTCHRALSPHWTRTNYPCKTLSIKCKCVGTVRTSSWWMETNSAGQIAQGSAEAIRLHSAYQNLQHTAITISQQTNYKIKRKNRHPNRDTTVVMSCQICKGEPPIIIIRIVKINRDNRCRQFWTLCSSINKSTIHRKNS